MCPFPCATNGASLHLSLRLPIRKKTFWHPSRHNAIRSVGSQSFQTEVLILESRIILRETNPLRLKHVETNIKLGLEVWTSSTLWYGICAVDLPEQMDSPPQTHEPGSNFPSGQWVTQVGEGRVHTTRTICCCGTGEGSAPRLWVFWLLKERLLCKKLKLQWKTEYVCVLHNVIMLVWIDR